MAAQPAGGQQQQRQNLSQAKEALLKSYQKQLRDDVKSISENFSEIVKMARVDDDSQVSKALQGELNHREMQVRAANMVRAGESLLKLVSDIKQFLILNDFMTVNDAIAKNIPLFNNMRTNWDSKLMALRDDISADLYDLEEEYYSSMYK